MATIFRFIVEDKATKAMGTQVAVSPAGAIMPKKGAGSKHLAYTGSNRGVEHNRYGRVINPLLNKVTGGWWEKGMRVGRGIQGMAETAEISGWNKALVGVGSIVITQLILMETVKFIEKSIKEANQANQSNLLRIRSGLQVLSRDYQVQKNIFGKISYKSQ